MNLHSKGGGSENLVDALRSGKCHAGTGATVAQVPEPRPKSVMQEPEPQWKASTGTAQCGCGADVVQTSSETTHGAISGPLQVV